ncbi:MAG: DNA-protecting protein DprA, partial [Bryobacterales bacterium]|nr:DNA-protecting protein DprA [Bryobacterales bacterium]
MTPEEELHWLALRLIPGLGTRRAVQLLERFRSPVQLFRASTSDLEAAGLPGSVARSISSGCTFDDAVGQQEKLKAAGGWIIALTGAGYPELLKTIYDPPPVL